MKEVYDRKYGQDSSLPEVKSFHTNRRMFAIKDSRIYLAPTNADYSHAKWFENEGWITPKDDHLMNSIVRGQVDPTGVYFYQGYDFSLSEESFRIMKAHLKELIDKLQIPMDFHLYGGIVKQSKPGRWPPKKDFGSLQSLL
jgi:hypothetical protein